jgi:hypothetical protein
MLKASGTQDVPPGAGKRRAVSIMLWLAVVTGWLVSIFSVIEELCLATACRDTAGFTVFGFNMGFFGIAYFSLVLILLRLRKSDYRLDLALAAMVFAGTGAELRLLWIQKYIIGGWCPLCVTICCALFLAATLLVVEKLQGGTASGPVAGGWIAFVAAMFAAGLVIALVGVKALT